MVEFPPLAPDANWFATYFGHKKEGVTDKEAIITTNFEIASSRDFGRYQITQSIGNNRVLSVAVEGGGRQLRNIDKIQDLILSEHGDWRHNHLKSLEAILGKKPYFPYLYPDLVEVYLNKNLHTLRDFNSAIFNVLLSFIIKDIDLQNLFTFLNNNSLWEARGKEIATRMNQEISSVEIISSLGKEALLGFLALNL